MHLPQACSFWPFELSQLPQLSVLFKGWESKWQDKEEDYKAELNQTTELLFFWWHKKHQLSGKMPDFHSLRRSFCIAIYTRDYTLASQWETLTYVMNELLNPKTEKEENLIGQINET